MPWARATLSQLLNLSTSVIPVLLVTYPPNHSIRHTILPRVKEVRFSLMTQPFAGQCFHLGVRAGIAGALLAGIIHVANVLDGS